MQCVKKIDNFIIQEKIGTGASSDVYLGLDPSSDVPVALKLVSPSQLKLFENEAKFYRSVPRHCNILKNIYTQQNGMLQDSQAARKLQRQAFFAFEYCPKGEIFDFILNLGCFPEPVGRWYFTQLLDALDVIHSQGLHHGDVKPENILIADNYTLKLSDFGFSDSNEKNGDLIKGTEGYMSPEALAQEKYCGAMSDIFASCVVLFTMLTGFPPFKKASPQDEYYQYIVEENYDEYWKSLPSHTLPDDLKILFQRSFAYKPEDRMQLNELREHPWMKRDVASDNEVIQFMQNFN